MSNPEAARCEVAVSVGAGQFNDPPDMPGLAHLTEHVVYAAGFDKRRGSRIFSDLPRTESLGGRDGIEWARRRRKIDEPFSLDWFTTVLAGLREPYLRDLDPLERWLEASDAREGDCNAFTGYEETLFYASASPKTLKDGLMQRFTALYDASPDGGG